MFFNKIMLFYFSNQLYVISIIDKKYYSGDIVFLVGAGAIG